MIQWLRQKRFKTLENLNNLQNMTFGGVIIIKTIYPTNGEMLRLMRRYRNCKQSTLAIELNVTRSLISQYENNEIPCPDHILVSSKHILDMEYLPTCESDNDEYEDMLNKLFDLISEDKLNEAEVYREKLSVIRVFPHEKNFNTLFSLHECRLLFRLNKVDEGKAILSTYENIMYSLNDIQKYYYYFNEGTYNLKISCIDIASQSYKKALKLRIDMHDNHRALKYNIAYCDATLGFVSLSIVSVKEVCKSYPKGKDKSLLFWSQNLLGNLYTCIGILSSSEKANDKAYEIALEKYERNRNEESKLFLGSANFGYGYMYRRAKKYKLSKEYFDKAIDMIPKTHNNYLEALFHKSCCCIEMKNTSSCLPLISEGLKLSKNKKSYNLAFKGLEIVANPNEDSAKELEEKILPLLLKANSIQYVLYFATFLSDYYKARGQGFLTRSYKMSELAMSIYKKCLEGSEI